VLLVAQVDADRMKETESLIAQLKAEIAAVGTSTASLVNNGQQQSQVLQVADPLLSVCLSVCLSHMWTV